ncbi:MAG: SDR family oxidoreductase [Chloroflexi bacterium]|nr:SDR family oxidoreductase [Chloroflexota bacterium]
MSARTISGSTTYDRDLRFQRARGAQTGAGAGFGFAITEALAKAGASVCAVDINPDRCDRLLEAVQAAGAQAVAFHGDVSNRFQAAAAIEHARAAFGKVDTLVNAAGIFKGGDLLLLDEWDWRRILDVNLSGAFFMAQLLGRVMADEGGGTILNLASTGARPEGVGFVASKAGVVGLTQQIARELARYNVRCNAVMLGDVGEDDIPSEPTTRTGTLEDAVGAAMFLLSNAAKFITGQVLHRRRWRVSRAVAPQASATTPRNPPTGRRHGHQTPRLLHRATPQRAHAGAISRRSARSGLVGASAANACGDG